jgi:hypothetical protein
MFDVRLHVIHYQERLFCVSHHVSSSNLVLPYAMKVTDILRSMNDYLFYVNHPNVLERVKWEPIGNSSITFDKSCNEEATFVVPVKITSNRYSSPSSPSPSLVTYCYHRLFVGPLGTYSTNVGTMEKTKYRMTCSAPDEPELKSIFEKGIQTFTHLQGMVSKSKDRRYLIETVNDEHRLLASLAVFEKRVRVSYNHLFFFVIQLTTVMLQAAPVVPYQYLEDLTSREGMLICRSATYEVLHTFCARLQ